jgi:hypothetical protein
MTPVVPEATGGGAPRAGPTGSPDAQPFKLMDILGFRTLSREAR